MPSATFGDDVRDVSQPYSTSRGKKPPVIFILGSILLPSSAATPIANNMTVRCDSFRGESYIETKAVSEAGMSLVLLQTLSPFTKTGLVKI
ncbi:hypothetical protein RRG08_005946 [Elysia crispata]|uniref:Uncharacterized protein n=1 Tax=Elysia crispata TaxID=231223 RepID=A0AAE0ZJG9_9GAST|nr:hypothetical protein RRG08_005946 [Elysia crispata]